jgi:hypothetical protein
MGFQEPVLLSVLLSLCTCNALVILLLGLVGLLGSKVLVARELGQQTRVAGPWLCPCVEVGYFWLLESGERWFWTWDQMCRVP